LGNRAAQSSLKYGRIRGNTMSKLSQIIERIEPNPALRYPYECATCGPRVADQVAHTATGVTCSRCHRAVSPVAAYVAAQQAKQDELAARIAKGDLPRWMQD
jgi:hypothetical protein